ncbi:MAG: carboxypeptidase-like regulatory domain-containing protein, partial [Candidatus Saccharimonadales bacterium]
MKLRLLSKTLKPALLFLLCLATARLAEGQGLTVRGRVIDEQGQPVAGATVIEKGTSNGTITDEKGGFILHASDQDDSLVISNIGYEKTKLKAAAAKGTTLTLRRSSNELDQTVIRAYGTTTRRLNTGDISTVTAREIGQQPVSNPLAALEGRVPGLVVTQSSGVPGSAFKVQIMGQNSIAQGSEPLFVIDGIPYAPNNNFTNQLTSAAVANDRSGLSPFSSLNPSDIASVEILKDA